MKKAKNFLGKKIPRIILFILLDTFSLVLTSLLSLWLRFSDSDTIPQQYALHLVRMLPLSLALTYLIYGLLGLYTSVWQYASIPELINIVIGTATVDLFAFGLQGVINAILTRGFFIIHFIWMIAAVCFTRYAYRLSRYIVKGVDFNNEKTRTMIIGAGDAARMLIDEVTRNRYFKNRIVCIVDDNRNKKGSKIHNIPIVGTRKDIEEAVYRYGVKEIIIAIPSASKEEISKIIKECQKTDCTVKILPSIVASMEQGSVSFIQNVRPISYEDFLGRDQIVVNNEEITSSLTDKVVLVTGGGGSIGSELCRQIAKANPKLLIIFDIYENNAYDIQQELLRNYPELNLKAIIGSVRDYARLEKVFQEYQPEIVFHAAAHKHVPLMEVSPNEAIKNNCLGTLNTVKLADKYKSKKFVLISTDKAVRPTNIMGASKRICEMIVQSYAKISKNTSYVAVRFGNVLGSNGSVIPLFLKQIEAGGPVTVTHKEITRYFMTIPEAVSLVLQASVYAEGGEIFVLDMGKPVKIYDLAKQIIRYKGLEPGKDIEIKITGLRPGEKLYEEMLMEEEGLKETPNKLIHIGQPLKIKDDFLADLEQLITIAQKNDGDIKKWTAKLVTTYKPQKENE